jgi:hypothetical protein
MDIIIDFTSIKNFFNLPPDIMLWRFLATFGWIILGIMFLAGVRIIWLKYVRTKWSKNIKFTFLAIDVPRGNIQSPKAIENFFAYIAGAHGTQNFFDKWFSGEYQLSFSFEIASLDGYTQFIIRTPTQFINLVESAIYSQYPDAEIMEIDDYCEDFPKKFPDEEYDIWGSEFIPSNHYMYPIRTYEEFEHRLGPDETVFRDPMAELMELCSSLKRGENLLYQIIVIPTGFDWIDDGKGEIDKILGKKPEATFANKIIDAIIGFITFLSEFIYSLWADIDDEKKDEFKKLSMMELTPRQKKRIEGIENKSAKLGFLCKIRVVYLSKKEVMNKSKVPSGFVGYIKQFSALDLNSFRPDARVMTKAVYFNKDRELLRKKNNIITNYINRDDVAGSTPFLLNVEELATLWHFPIEAMANAPLIQKTAAKKYKPPANLAVDDMATGPEALKEEFLKETSPRKKQTNKNNLTNDNPNDYLNNSDQNISNSNYQSVKKTPPSNLPFG